MVNAAYKACGAGDFSKLEAMCGPDFKYFFGLPNLPGFKRVYTAVGGGAATKRPRCTSWRRVPHAHRWQGPQHLA